MLISTERSNLHQQWGRASNSFSHENPVFVEQKNKQ